MEAMFSFMFWTMRSRTKVYGCGQLCPWDRLGFEWHGLNTHNPLTEAVDGDFNLSAEALEAIAAEIAEKNRLYQVDYRLAERARSPERVRARQREKNHRHKAAGKARDDAVKAAKKLFVLFAMFPAGIVVILNVIMPRNVT
jgi:hypothetical protein